MVTKRAQPFCCWSASAGQTVGHAWTRRRYSALCRLSPPRPALRASLQSGWYSPSGGSAAGRHSPSRDGAGCRRWSAGSAPGKVLPPDRRPVIHLGGDNHLVAAGAGRANDLFAAAVGVAICGIEEVDAAFNGVLDKRAAALPEASVPAAVRLAEGHAAEAESGNT